MHRMGLLRSSVFTSEAILALIEVSLLLKNNVVFSHLDVEKWESSFEC